MTVMIEHTKACYYGPNYVYKIESKKEIHSNIVEVTPLFEEGELRALILHTRTAFYRVNLDKTCTFAIGE